MSWRRGRNKKNTMNRKTVESINLEKGGRIKKEEDDEEKEEEKDGDYESVKGRETKYTEADGEEKYGIEERKRDKGGG
jgi:hypothetical protein